MYISFYYFFSSIINLFIKIPSSIRMNINNLISNIIIKIIFIIINIITSILLILVFNIYYIRERTHLYNIIVIHSIAILILLVIIIIYFYRKKKEEKNLINLLKRIFKKINKNNDIIKND